MSRFQTYRIIVRKTETHVIDLPASDQIAAMTRAERLWHSPQRHRFQRLSGFEPEVFEIDEVASNHLADVANEDRAQWAENALKSFSRETGSDMGAEALHDLLCDLGHYADGLGIDFDEAMKRAAKTWAEENAEAQQGAQP